MISVRDFAAAVGATPDEVFALLGEIVPGGLPSTDPDASMLTDEIADLVRSRWQGGGPVGGRP